MCDINWHYPACPIQEECPKFKKNSEMCNCPGYLPWDKNICKDYQKYINKPTPLVPVPLVKLFKKLKELKK